MAIASTTTWYYDASATAGNVNGGGFNPGNATPGTNKATTTGPAYTFTDLSTTNGTSNPATVHSASHAFDSTDLGNLIHINSGGTFLAGWYELVSLSGSDAVLDRACASSASTSGGTYHVGGAISLGAASDATTLQAATSGNIIYVKLGTYNVGAAAFTGTNATSPAITKMIGYQTTITDNPTGANRPTFALGTNVFTMGNNWEVYNIIVTGTAAGIFSTNSHGKVFNSKFVNNSTTAGRNCLVLGTDSVAMGCEAVSYRGMAIGGSVSGQVIGCYLHDSDIGFSNSGTTSELFVAFNLIESCVSNAIKLTGANTSSVMLMNNTLAGGVTNKTGTGISLAAGTTATRAYNNIVYGFVTGISATDANQTINSGDYNDVNNNTSNYTNWAAGIHDITTSPQFANVAQVTGTNASTSASTLTDNSADFSNVVNNQDFLYVISGGPTAGQYLITSHTAHTVTVDIALGTTASGVSYQVTTGRNYAVGTNMKAKAFPGAFGATITTGYLDIGGAQRQEPTQTTLAATWCS